MYKQPEGDPNFRCYATEAFKKFAKAPTSTNWEHVRYLWVTKDATGRTLVYLWGEPGYWRVINNVTKWFGLTRKVFGITAYYAGDYNDFIHKIEVADAAWYAWKRCNVGGGPPMAPASVHADLAMSVPATAVPDYQWIAPPCTELGLSTPEWWKPWWGDADTHLQGATPPPDWWFWAPGRNWPGGSIPQQCAGKMYIPSLIY